MTLGERIKRRRKELGLTQEELARILGNSSRTSVCTVEKDRDDLTSARLIKYAEALKTTPDQLLGFSGSVKEGNENLSKLMTAADGCTEEEVSLATKMLQMLKDAHQKR